MKRLLQCIEGWYLWAPFCGYAKSKQLFKSVAAFFQSLTVRILSHRGFADAFFPVQKFTSKTLRAKRLGWMRITSWG